jgi:hypothetical protein
MTRVQQSIEISVPVHTAYHQLTQFEDYPHFMQDVETVHQLDDTHLRWSTKLSYQTLEWDAEITEQLPDRCIAWRNLSGPSKAGKVELQPLGSEKARVTFTMECEPSEILAAPEGNAEAVMAQQLEQDLARFKAFIETRGAQAGSAPVPTSSYAAGSEGWDGNEDPAEPALSSARNAATRLDEKKTEYAIGKALAIFLRGRAASGPHDAVRCGTLPILGRWAIFGCGRAELRPAVRSGAACGTDAARPRCARAG